MRFVILRKADRDTEAAAMPGAALAEAMTRYNEELVKAGVFLGGEGLKPSRDGVRVKFTDGKPKVIDGPFAETKELVAGFTLIQARSREEALEWVKRWPTLDGDGDVELELRPVYELADFGEAFTPEVLAIAERHRPGR